MKLSLFCFMNALISETRAYLLDDIYLVPKQRYYPGSRVNLSRKDRQCATLNTCVGTQIVIVRFIINVIEPHINVTMTLTALKNIQLQLIYSHIYTYYASFRCFLQDTTKTLLICRRFICIVVYIVNRLNVEVTILIVTWQVAYK